MSDAISTITSSSLEGVDKAALVTRIVKNSTQLLEDYVLWNQCGWSDEEFGDLLGISAKTVKNRYLADARKQGLIEQHHNSRSEQNTERARNRARTVENSTTASESKSTSTPDQTDDSYISTVSNSFAVPIPESYVDSYSDGQSETVVSMGTQDERNSTDEFEKAQRLIKELTELHRRNFKGGISEPHWEQLSEDYAALKYFADIRWQRHRAEMERSRDAFRVQLDNAKTLAAQSVGTVSQLSSFGFDSTGAQAQ